MAEGGREKRLRAALRENLRRRKGARASPDGAERDEGRRAINGTAVKEEPAGSPDRSKDEPV
jgi:hypothetical protein